MVPREAGTRTRPEDTEHRGCSTPRCRGGRQEDADAQLETVLAVGESREDLVVYALDPGKEARGLGSYDAIDRGAHHD